MNEIGLIGLGVMGSNLILNIYDNFNKNISGFDIDQNKINDFQSILNKELKDEIILFSDLQKFVLSIKKPRKIIILIPAGKYVDMLLENLLPLLDKNDNILDGGNEWYKNTESRQSHKLILEKDINYLGCGISGGENGARNGPCMMPGGSLTAYKCFEDVLLKICVKYKDDVCVSYFGKGGIGNYIKMVHNGIEYALMQIISEVYLILKNNKLTNSEIANTLETWNKNLFNCYLLEITIKILRKKDNDSSDYLLDKIVDIVESKGTGHMTVIDALEKKVPINIIYSALEFRNISSFKKNIILSNENDLINDFSHKNLNEDIKNAMYLGFILSFIQGLNLINEHYKMCNDNNSIDLINLLKVWRNGCIIKCNLLSDLITYLDGVSNINKLYDFLDQKKYSYYSLYKMIQNNVNLPLITLNNCHIYFNLIYSKNLESGKLLQAMRDCFGGHMYERSDKNGKFHTEWI